MSPEYEACAMLRAAIMSRAGHYPTPARADVVVGAYPAFACIVVVCRLCRRRFNPLEVACGGVLCPVCVLEMWPRGFALEKCPPCDGGGCCIVRELVAVHEAHVEGERTAA